MANSLIGMMLVDAPHSALNNAGAEEGGRTENTIGVKKIQKGWNKVYPYVSAQAVRNWWRGTLADRYGWRMSPIERDKKTAFTKADPITFPDDDLFGYMRAEKNETVTRVSPFKCSPLLSVVPQDPTTDFGVMSRHQGDPVPYEHEFYSVVLKGAFSLDLDATGCFISEKRSGYMNLQEEAVQKALDSNQVERVGDYVRLPVDNRAKRAVDWLSALPYLSGGAKQANHLTDVSPVFVILGGLSCGNHIFMQVIGDENGTEQFRAHALRQALQDYAADMTSPVWIGRRAGFHDDWDEVIQNLCNERPGGVEVRSGSVKGVVEECAGWLRSFYLEQ